MTTAVDPSHASRESRAANGRYTRTAIALHWTMAVLIVANVVLGWTMSDLPFSPARIRLFNYHKWTGITILLLAAARLAWRLGHRPPPIPDDVTAWQRRAAHAVHGLLYALFFAVPLAGWAYSSAAGFPITFLGLIRLPDWVPVDEALAKQLMSLHATLAYGLAAVVVLHVAAALRHAMHEPVHYLRRITPGF